MELITIPFSHYNERARWALEHYGLPFDERRYAPMLHFWGVWRATRGRVGEADRVSTRYSTPVLVAETKTIVGSGPILHWANERGSAESSLYPTDHRSDIEQFETMVHDRVGPHARRIWYWTACREPAVLRHTIRNNVDSGQAILFTALGPGFVPMLRRALAVRRDVVERSVEKLRSQFAEVGEVLAEKRYLFADRFTAADLTLAALAAPVLQPVPEYGANMAAIPEAAEAKAWFRMFRETPAGRHALRMFREHRRPATHGSENVGTS